MPRLADLDEISRQGQLNFAAFEHDDAPFVPLARSLAETTVALVTTAGLHLRDDAPFTFEEQTYRVIPSETPARDLLQSQTSSSIDRTAFIEDPNSTFPIDRLRELVDGGVIGGLAPNFYSFMGALATPRIVETETGPEVGRRLLDEGAGAVVLTPT